MRKTLACLLLMALAACDRETAPADEVATKAKEIVELAEPKPAPVSAGRFAPQNTCGSVEGAQAFRARLAEVVRTRDVEGLIALAASDVKLDFGDGAGTDELRKRLTSDEWNLWQELDELMTLGCSANAQGGITIPWYFDQDIPGAASGTAMLVTGQNIPVLAAPDPQAPRIDTVSWDVVRVDAWKPDQPYQQVRIRNRLEAEADERERVRDAETTGYIATDQLRSLLDYRLIASHRNGKWSITSFVAGD
ncbi:hypothetical protein [Altericroceibacterium xinjiangense]|uniref:hypothetical protein n=1 Tax=Altericroceibacterium xinjiangense TaxID=762261 RepID=UPI000F7DE9A4|nr:hypothetical protein [Altericroceibacterium xinjiangense]